ELIARYPGGHLVRVRDLKADTKAEVGVFDHAVEIPPRRNLVRRLVVVVLLVRLVLFPAPTLGPADEVDSRPQVHRGHADLREAELVRSIEGTAIGKLIAGNDSIFGLRDLLDNRIERRFPLADIHEVFRAAPDVRAVEIQVRRDLA